MHTVIHTLFIVNFLHLSKENTKVRPHQNYKYHRSCNSRCAKVPFQVVYQPRRGTGAVLLCKSTLVVLIYNVIALYAYAKKENTMYAYVCEQEFSSGFS